MLCSGRFPGSPSHPLMAHVEPRVPTRPSASTRAKPPSVLVVLVVKDGAEWLPQCLLALSRQTHPRIGLLGVDNGSSDGSADLLASVIGEGHVLRLARNEGFAGGVGEALRTQGAQQADYILLLHDDTLLAPDAISALVEAAERVEDAGVVGPKIVDWEDPRVLREVGFATDRFGYPYSPLEDGEIDQGQYDRIREVLFVSSCATLVARSVWGRVGPPDERFRDHQEDLEFCWRARLAGFRVLMAPAAVARHRGASIHGEREDSEARARYRYQLERAALASILKNYGLLSLVWILPLYVVQGLIRLSALAVTRRFEDAYQVLAAWGWNLAHLPGTIRRRVRAQAVRAIPDRVVRRSMAPAGLRLRRWASSAADALLPKAAEGESEPSEVPVRARVAQLMMGHPAATAWLLAVVVGLVAYRHLAAASPLAGGALQAFPGAPSDFLREFGSGLRHTGLGGTAAASPAIGLLGAASVVSFGSPALLQKILLLGLPALAALGAYRAVRSETSERAPAALAAACYGLSSAGLWALSEGRLPALVYLAGLPWLATKIPQAFRLATIKVHPVRWMVGAGVGMSVLGSFFPGTVLAAIVVLLSSLVVHGRRSGWLRGLGLAAASVATAMLLAFPLVLELARAGGAGLVDRAGPATFASLLRLSPGSAPGDWPTGFFLPVAAAIALVFVAGELVGVAVRTAVASTASVYLAWLSAAGYMPTPFANTLAYLGVAAFGYSMLVGLGLTFLVRGVARESFGHRQVGAAFMGVVLAGGLIAQGAQAAIGGWAVGGPDRIADAYPLAGRAGGPSYRVLWIGAPGGEAFPPPGGPPDGGVDAGAASVRFAVTSPAGASAFDIGRPASGPGYSRLRLTLQEILAGDTRHGGALLAPFGIRFVVGRSGDIPSFAAHRLARQLDLDVVPTQGLTILLNAGALPLAAQIEDSVWRRVAFSGDLASASSLPAPQAVELEGGGVRYSAASASSSSLVLLSQQFDSHWRLIGPDAKGALLPDSAFGWAVGFRPGTQPSGFEVRFEGQRIRTSEVLILLLLWAMALWITRRPVRGD